MFTIKNESSNKELKLKSTSMAMFILFFIFIGYCAGSYISSLSTDSLLQRLANSNKESMELLNQQATFIKSITDLKNENKKLSTHIFNMKQVKFNKNKIEEAKNIVNTIKLSADDTPEERYIKLRKKVFAESLLGTEAMMETYNQLPNQK